MKKKMIISFIVVATVMSFIGSSYSNNNTNDLLLDNIEALANGEQENGIKMHRRRNSRLPYWYQSRSSNQILWFRIAHETHFIYCFFSVYYVLARNQRKRKSLVW